MRITRTQLRNLIRETLESDSGADESTEEEEYGALSSGNKWLGEIPAGILTTCSSKPIAGVRDTARDCISAHKPAGLWYADGVEWIDWMRYEMPSWLDKVNYVYRVVPSASVLKLKTPQAIRAFHNNYGSRDAWTIRWDAVADEYDGVEIIPYHRELRYSDISWYYTWDIASGCIWRPSGIAELELIAKRPGL